MQDGAGTGRLQASQHRNEEGKAPSLDGSAAAVLLGLALLEQGAVPARAAAPLLRAAHPHLCKAVERGVEMWE